MVSKDLVIVLSHWGKLEAGGWPTYRMQSRGK